LCSQMVAGMSAHEAGMFIDEERRTRILRAIVDTYYADAPPDSVVFDSSRRWCCVLAGLNRMYPGARVLCCVRSVAWILDSIERHVRRNPFHESGLFDRESSANVYSRAEHMSKRLIGSAVRCLRQAWCSEESEMLIFVRYESMVANPRDVLMRIYSLLNEEWFEHNFDQVAYSEPEFDSRL